MRKKTSLVAALATLAFGLLVFTSAPSVSYAANLTINEVDVTVGAFTWCGSAAASATCTAGATTYTIWTGAAGFNGSPVILAPSETLVLTQTNVPTGPAGSPELANKGFNFDSSDFCGGTCAAPTVTIRGISTSGAAFVFTFTDATRILATPGDPINTTFNEARNWFPTFLPGFSDPGGSGTDIALGYADNLHTDACADAVGSVANNCLPDGPWQGSATHFFGSGASGIGFGIAPGGAFHCDPNAASTLCFDAGAIVLENSTRVVPEPSTLLLLGTGLLSVAAYRRRSVKKNS